jgi:Lrp/AsnC family leucine-responsive transcriptional regulator
MPVSAKLDQTDVKIIRALQKDARTSFADIAKDTGVSVDTISKRFRRLLKSKVARGTTVLLNPKSFGYDCVASFGIRVDYPHVQEVMDFVRKIPEVCFCTQSMGMHNLFTIAVLRNVGRLSQLKEAIKGHPMVREVSASIWIDEILLCPENFEFTHLRRK